MRQGKKEKETHFGQYTPTASDVQDVHALQHTARLQRGRSGSSTGASIRLFVAPQLEHLFADEAYPVWVHLVEERKFAAFVPP